MTTTTPRADPERVRLLAVRMHALDLTATGWLTWPAVHTSRISYTSVCRLNRGIPVRLTAAQHDALDHAVTTVEAGRTTTRETP